MGERESKPGGEVDTYGQAGDLFFLLECSVCVPPCSNSSPRSALKLKNMSFVSTCLVRVMQLLLYDGSPPPVRNVFFSFKSYENTHRSRNDWTAFLSKRL